MKSLTRSQFWPSVLTMKLIDYAIEQDIEKHKTKR